MKVKVSDVAILNRTNLKYKGKYEDIIYLDTGNITEGKINELQFLNVKNDKIPSRAQRAVKDGTIVISTVRPVLCHYGYIKTPAENMVVSSGFVTVDAKDEIIDSRYLYYILSSPKTTTYLTDIAATAVSSYPSFTPDDLGDMEIEIIEDIVEQRKIASVLGNIDDMIENNNAISGEIENYVMTLYNYWFVQHDFPNKNNFPYKASEGNMVYSELLKRNIPEKWRVIKLEEIATIENVSVTPSKGTLYHHYSIPAFDKDQVPIKEDGECIDSGKYEVPYDSLLLSKLNPHFKRLWITNDVKNNSICSTEFMPFISKNDKRAYLYAVLNSDAFYTFMTQSSSSSTGSRKRIQPELCLSYIMEYPENDEVIDRFCEQCNDAVTKIAELKELNHELFYLKRYLLPKLITGQAIIKEK